MIEFQELPYDFPTSPPETLYECSCEQRTGGYTMSIEEGQASVIHNECDLPLWFESEEIWAEFPVTVNIETCDNPGGWHGMERCECGPEITIELDYEQV